MLKKVDYTDEELLTQLTQNGEAAIDLIFRKYYTFLCRSVYRIIPDTQITEDLAQDVFYELWKKREKININTSLRAYLKRAALNKALNYIRDQKIDFRNAPPKEDLASKSNSVLQNLAADNLQAQIDAAIDSLPEKCRLVFVLSRYEEMTYQQIADQLNISIKTVENQISKALKNLRKALSEHLPTALLTFIFAYFQLF
ncbi:MAG: RNA polymerase sigma-70 factor [Bacteroidota bacterium]